MKPSTIEVVYRTSVDVVAIEDTLNIKWEDVDSYYVKWGALFLTMKSGEELEYSATVGDSARKRPSEINEISVTDNYKLVSLVVNSYVCPDCPEGIERAKEALVADFDNSVRNNWDPYTMIHVSDENSENAQEQVPPWLLEDLEEILSES